MEAKKIDCQHIDDMITYREAKKTEVGEISKLYADSFNQYPLYRDTIRNRFADERSFAQFLYRFQYVLTTAFFEQQICLVGEIDGMIATVALLEKPDGKKVNVWDYIRNGGLRILKYVGLTTILSFLRFIDRTDAACNAIKKQRWHLTNLAVNKQYQGKQLGSKMIQDCLIPFVKNQHGSLFTLVTNTESNSRFYEKNGFTLFDKRTVHWKNHSVQNWSFCKDLT